MGDAKFRSQHPIGPYIVDFVSLAHMLVVEVDGGHHNQQPRGNLDRARSAWLEQHGYRVVRFWNNDVDMDIEGVLAKINESLDARRSPSPYSSPLRERRE